MSKLKSLLVLLQEKFLNQRKKVKEEFMVVEKRASSKPGSLLYLNEKGMTFIAPLILMLVFSLGTLLINRTLKENQAVKDRARLLLCQKEYEFSRRGYIQNMSRLNLLIETAFALRFIPPAGPYAQRVQEAAKKFQQFYHVSHLKKPLGFKFCSSSIGILYIKNLPYKSKRKVVLVRRLDGTVPLVKKTWREVIWTNSKTIVIKSKYSLEGRFDQAPKVKRRELSKEALLSWRPSSGPLSFLP